MVNEREDERCRHCEHARVMHEDGGHGRCTYPGCTCTSFREF